MSRAIAFAPEDADGPLLPRCRRDGCENRVNRIDCVYCSQACYMASGVRRPVSPRPPCGHCGKPVKHAGRVYCSHACYTASGARRETGKVNGAQAYKLYWMKFDEIFQRKWGHLPSAVRTRLLVVLGMKRAYRKTYNQRFARPVERADDTRAS